jgi:acetylornithine deacetylase/succinyl-diaminopimelate desuccinylase-like protein
MELVVAHKGKKSWRCRVRGHEAHSSLTPLGVNAVQIACEIVAWIARRARDRKELEKIYQVNENALKVRLFRARQRVLKAYEGQAEE